MNPVKRAAHVLTGIVMILGCILMLADPERGYKIVILILDLTLILAGIRLVVYYLTMARYMVDSLKILYKGAFLLDAGLFVFLLADVPKTLAMLYLILCLAFTGVVRLLRAMEARQIGSRAWRRMLAVGSGRLLLAAVSLFFLHSAEAMTLIYCFGLVNSTVEHFRTAFTTTAVVYIEG